MGITLEQWRAVIGCFSQPVKSVSRLKTLKMKYVSLSVRVLLFYLLVVEGIESNPGPPRRGAGGLGARGCNGGARGFGPPRGRGLAQADYFANFPTLSETERQDRP
ncbi:MAG: hypothetical protein AB2693_25140 [Candidatus Thiodiazotropha sp.]